MTAERDHSRVTPEGRLLGDQTARACDAAIAEIGGPDERCKSCAGVYGTVPNGCPVTQMDFIKAVVENVTFRCHYGDRPPCVGWKAVRATVKGKVGVAPWEFSQTMPAKPWWMMES